VRVVGRAAAPLKWFVVDLKTGRQSTLRTSTLEKEYRPVADRRATPARVQPIHRHPNSDRGRPPKALDSTIGKLLEAGPEGLTIPEILVAFEDEKVSINEWTIRRYLTRLVAEKRVAIFRPDEPRSPWLYALVNPETEAEALLKRTDVLTFTDTYENDDEPHTRPADAVEANGEVVSGSIVVPETR